MNIVIFLTMRYHSTRLPQKALLKIDGQTVADILIDRLKQTGMPIIMCTTDTPEDRQYLKPIADKHNIGYHESPPGNIIKQHYDCSVVNGVDWIINVDGDDILVVPDIIKEVVNLIEKNTQFHDVICTVGNPLGLNILAYKAKTLKDIHYNSNTNWGFQIKSLPRGLTRKYFNDDEGYRLTLDYPEDFTIIKDILINCKDNITVQGICNYLNVRPDISKVNSFRNKEYWNRINNASQCGTDSGD